AYGLLVLRSMLGGASFNHILSPDPADISRDMAWFMTTWSPGQYLTPGVLVALGMKYGHALSLTILLASCVGLAGWACVARRIEAPPVVVLLFLVGLAAFQFATVGERVAGGRSGGFLMYHGGEVLLFAVAPWALLALMTCLDAHPVRAFATTLA